MSCARHEAWRSGLIVAMASAQLTIPPCIALAVPVADVPPTAREIVRRADQMRGIASPCHFRARIASRPQDPESRVKGAIEKNTDTLVEVWANGYAQQLVLVREPTRGDAMLVTPDVVWLRPRHLHRLTRVPPDLRLFSGVSVSDVIAVDLLGNYEASMSGEVGEKDPYVVELAARAEGVRYPRARYRIARDDLRPLGIEFMTASGRPLKSIQYEDFGPVLDRTIATRLVVTDYVYQDSATVLLSDFQTLPHVDSAKFSPDYLLTLGDGAL